MTVRCYLKDLTPNEGEIVWLVFRAEKESATIEKLRVRVVSNIDTGGLLHTLEGEVLDAPKDIPNIYASAKVLFDVRHVYMREVVE